MKLFVYQLGFETKTKLKSTFKSISFLVDEAVNPTSESHDSIARMNYLRKRKKENT